MISQKMQDALSEHASQEVYSAYLYLAMGASCDTKAYKGFGRWLRVQHEEELDHARKLIDYVVERGGRPTFAQVSAPPREFGTLVQLFEAVLSHERQVTERIHALYQAAAAEKDAAAQVFLQWFVGEQVEEEARVQEIVDKLRLVGDRPGAALYLDKEYGKRGKAG
jgi:ferritin